MEEVDKKILSFWDERSELGQLAGTNDFVMSDIEKNFFHEIVPSGSRFLELGCGNGTTAIGLVKEKSCEGVAIDFSSGMVELAKKNVKDAGLENKIEIFQHALPPVPKGHGSFDIVYSQRCLINLKKTSAQKEAVLSVADVLKPGGKYIMVECSIDGSNKTNAIRQDLGLYPIDPPWHNLFFEEKEVESWSNESFYLEDIIHISSTYNFLSRVVYAKLANDKGEELKYDSDINLLAAKLPRSIGELGPIKAWIWQKAE